MLGIYSSIVRSLPKGRLQSALLSTLGPPTEGPGRLNYHYWDGAQITHTMADSRVANWERILAPFKSKLSSILEIGSYEGKSALFWLGFLPNSRLTCIDPWIERAPGVFSAAAVERHFDYNLRNLRDRCTKIKSKSTPALYALAEAKAKFDMI